MELTGLDITLRRMQAIESTFNSLANFGSEAINGRPNQDFQKILDNSMSEKIQNTPFSNKIFSSDLINQTTSNTNDIDSLIEQYSAKNGLDSAFVKAVIKQESGFQPNATSHCGAMGLMQLMPQTAESLGVIDP